MKLRDNFSKHRAQAANYREAMRSRLRESEVDKPLEPPHLEPASNEGRGAAKFEYVSWLEFCKAYDEKQAEKLSKIESESESESSPELEPKTEFKSTTEWTSRSYSTRKTEKEKTTSLWSNSTDDGSDDDVELFSWKISTGPRLSLNGPSNDLKPTLGVQVGGVGPVFNIDGTISLF